MPAAILVLEDGRSFRGEAFGAAGEIFGELTLSTGLAEYQEILASPDQTGRIVLFTAPHIGSTGWNDDHATATQIAAAGLVVRDPILRPSSWQASRALHEVLESKQVVGISGVDTRALARHLRGRDVMRAAISSTELDPDRLRQRLQQQSGSTDSAHSTFGEDA